MSHYKRNAADNRDALFGPSGSGTKAAPVKKSSNGPTRKPTSTSSISSATKTTMTIGGTTTTTTTTTKKSLYSKSLTGDAKVQKMKEAQDYREKAKKAMQRTLFSSPDPISASSFYHRAAEAYKLCGENRLERLHRIASGDCQMGHGAHATAAAEYVRAAELSEASDETVERKRKECSKLYEDAAKAWAEQGENGKKAECTLKSAMSFLIGTEEDMMGGRSLTGMERSALKAIEEAIESFVPDPLNRYSYLRKTGTSAFFEEGNNEITDDLLDLCRHHLVTSSYAHEKLYPAIYTLARWGEYASALYASGAVSQILEHDGFATISLARAYCAETVLALALGDVVTADKIFIEVHLQNNSYLTTRECKLAEDLIRAVKSSDIDALETARDMNGENRAAISNLDTSFRALVAELKISGAAKAVPKKAESVQNANGVVSQNSDDLEAEMNDLMDEMGIESEDDEEDDIDLT